MPALPKYVLAHNKDELPTPVVILTEKPWLIGKVFRFTDDREFVEFVANYTGLGIATVTGYRIVVAFYGSIPMRLPVQPGTDKDIKRVMEEMAAFYKKNNIDRDPGGFNRYLLVPPKRDDRQDRIR